MHLYDIFRASAGVNTDTRTLKEGQLFFALKGENFDGNAYALQALSAGAAYAVVNDTLEADDPRLIKVPDTLKALYASNAARSGSVAASTGQTLEKGSEGDAVRMLQRKLKDLGYLSGTVDGSYGIATEAAVIAFQQRNGLTPDGKCGDLTLQVLFGY